MKIKPTLNTIINRLTRPLIHYLQWRMLWEMPPIHGQGKFVYGKQCSITNPIINTRCGDVILGNDVAIGQNCMLITGSEDYTLTGLERLKSHSSEKRDIIIEDGVTINADCNINGGVRIGKNSVIGMGSNVTHDIPPNVYAWGEPARVRFKLEVINELDRKSQPAS